MISRICLVDAGAADAAALSAAGARLFVQTYGEYSNADDLAAHVRQYFGQDNVTAELRKPDVTYTVAYAADEIAGFVKVRDGDTPASVPATEAIEVQQLYVDAARQRQGVGRMLMDRAAAIAREKDREGIWLSVWQDADWATRFYESCGFTRVGTAEFRLGRSIFKDYLMYLPLNHKS